MQKVATIFVLLFHLLLVTAIEVFSQTKISKGDIFVSVRAGVTRGFSLIKETYTSPGVNISPTYREELPTWSFQFNACFNQMITKKLFYTGGIQYAFRKIYSNSNPDSLINKLPYIPYPVTEKNEYYHNLEYPFLLGILISRVSISAGFNFIVLYHHRLDATYLSGLEYHTSNKLDVTFYPITTITSSYSLSRKIGLAVFANFEKQFREPRYAASMGLLYLFDLNDK